jgi:hypothetical protein
MKNSSKLNNGSYGYQPVFREVQYFRTVFFIIPVLICLAAGFAFFAYQINKCIEKGLPFYPLLFPAIIIFLLFILLFIMKLEVEVVAGIARYRFFPMLPFWRQMELSSIETAEAVTYKPIREFGGWGIRYGKCMWAYTVSGNKGVVIKLKSGKVFLLGSKNPEELQRSLSAVL